MSKKSYRFWSRSGINLVSMAVDILFGGKESERARERRATGGQRLTQRNSHVACSKIDATVMGSLIAWLRVLVANGWGPSG